MAASHRSIIAAAAVALLAAATLHATTARAVAHADAAPEATVSGGDLGIFFFRVDPASLAALRIPEAGQTGALETAPVLPLGAMGYRLRLFFPPDYLTDDAILDYYPGAPLDPRGVLPHPPYLRLSARPSRAASAGPHGWFVADAGQQDALRTIIAQARATELSRTLDQQHSWYPDVLFAESPHFNGGDGEDAVQQDAYRVTPSVNGVEGNSFDLTGADAGAVFRAFIDVQNAAVTPVDDLNLARVQRFDVATLHGRALCTIYVLDRDRADDIAVVPDGARFALRPLGNPFNALMSRAPAEFVSPSPIMRGDDTPHRGYDATTLFLLGSVATVLCGFVAWRVGGWWLNR